MCICIQIPVCNIHVHWCNTTDRQTNHIVTTDGPTPLRKQKLAFIGKNYNIQLYFKHHCVTDNVRFSKQELSTLMPCHGTVA